MRCCSSAPTCSDIWRAGRARERERCYFFNLEVIGESYEPTVEEIAEYAKWLSMDLASSLQLKSLLTVKVKTRVLNPKGMISG
jgi:hypothetical protein